MELNQIIIFVASLLFAFFASWFLLVPFFRPEEVLDDDTLGEMKELSLKKEMLMNALEDLENDKFSGVLTGEQYESSKKELLAETAQCLSAIQRIQK